MEQFSAFMMDPVHGWIATHRLPLDSAVHTLVGFLEHHYQCPVAIVPDTVDPKPFLDFAEGNRRRLFMEKQLFDRLSAIEMRPPN